MLDLPLLTHVHSHITWAVAAMDSCWRFPTNSYHVYAKAVTFQAKKQFLNWVLDRKFII